jgi:hypothetical protein
MPASISCGFCAVPALSCEVLISSHGEAGAPLFLQRFSQVNGINGLRPLRPGAEVSARECYRL